jgi:hypothetical protein
MIYFCDGCTTFKTRDDFEEYNTYTENICIKCTTENPSEEELMEGDVLVRRLDEMMFGEDDEDFLPNDDFYDDEEDEDFVYDGEIEDEDEED